MTFCPNPSVPAETPGLSPNGKTPAPMAPGATLRADSHTETPFPDLEPVIRAWEGISPSRRRNLPREVHEGLDLLFSGRAFEAHESLEIAWRRETSPRKAVYLGLCQFAIFQFHRTRGNRRGADLILPRCRRVLHAAAKRETNLPLKELTHVLDRFRRGSPP